MKNIVFIFILSFSLFSCKEKMNACDCGKKMAQAKEIQEIQKCEEYLNSLNEKQKDAWMSESLKCYMNEQTGSQLK